MECKNALINNADAEYESHVDDILPYYLHQKQQPLCMLVDKKIKRCSWEGHSGIHFFDFALYLIMFLNEDMYCHYMIAVCFYCCSLDRKILHLRL